MVAGSARPPIWRLLGVAGLASLVLSAGAVRVDPLEPGVTRTYYVAAEEVLWDYAPSGADEIAGHPIDTAQFIIGNGPARAARSFRKAVYREYTDSTFSTRKPRPPEWEHLGILGPVLRAEVGDTIQVVFRNQTRKYGFSIHPHGVLYTKANEGALYQDGSARADKRDDSVPPGSGHTYVWPVPERAGPGPADPSSILWVYHSHTHEWRDFNAGLAGPIIIGRRGTFRADGRPEGIDREFVTLFGIFDEMESRYTPENLQTYTGSTSRAGRFGPIFFSAIGLESINGLAFGNLPLASLRILRGERVRWYVFGGTMAVDVHSAHWHGATLLIDGKRTDLANLGAPLVTATGDMLADVAGTWLLHCHTAEHMQDGMTARFVVEDSPDAGTER